LLNKKLNKLLSEKKSAILKKWFSAILESYPAEAAKYYKKHDKPFTNPVGSTIFNGLENLFDEVLQGKDFKTPPSSLEDIIRIRAVQDFAPSQALIFIPLLKKIIVEELKSEVTDPGMFGVFLELEAVIDNLAFQAFDVYVGFREKIYDLKVTEIQSLTSRHLQRANQIYDKYRQEHDFKFDNIDTVRDKETIK